MDGVLLVDKPPGMSSHSVVARVRRALGTRKVGHAGTLDPMATGLMLIGVGAGTRLLQFLVGLDKEYEATVRLGIATSTEDAEGDVTSAPGCPADVDPVAAVASLTGRIRQRPSSVSAIKVAGRRAYDRVRAGEDVVLAEREVEVTAFDLLRRTSGSVAGVPVVDLDVRVAVSSGTYVRALARDLGASLGTAGHLTALRRTRIGPFPLAVAVPLDWVNPQTRLLSLAEAASGVLPVQVLSAGDARAVRHGQRIDSGGAEAGPTALLDPEGALVAVARDDDGRWRYLMVVPTAQSGPPAAKPGLLRHTDRVMDIHADAPIPVLTGPDLAVRGSQGCVVCIGVFDGVHRGHRQLLARGRAEADRLGLDLIALTFDPHPMSVVRPDHAPCHLATLRHRITLLAGAGVDAVRICSFDRELSLLSPQDFALRYLGEDLAARVVVVGENFRFGHRAAGDVPELTRIGALAGFTVVPVGLAADDSGDVWSSSRIRALVADGDVAQAALGLLRPHRVEGVVIRGDRRGRELGYPTANVEPHGRLCRPRDGVYAAWAVIAPHSAAERRVPAAVSVGANRTFGGEEPRIEAYLMAPGDWDLYGEHLGVEFVDRIRDMAAFDSVAELVAAMANDVSAAQAALAKGPA